MFCKIVEQMFYKVAGLGHRKIHPIYSKQKFICEGNTKIVVRHPTYRVVTSSPLGIPHTASSHIPRHPTYRVIPHTASSHIPCHPTYRVIPHTASSHIPRHPTCRVIPHTASSHIPRHPTYRVVTNSPLGIILFITMVYR